MVEWTFTGFSRCIFTNIVIANEFTAGCSVSTGEVWGDVGILATPRNRFGGKISLTACVWEAGRWDTEEIQGYKSTKPDPPLSI